MLDMPFDVVEEGSKSDEKRFLKVEAKRCADLPRSLDNSMPKRTKKNNNWEVKLYKDWRTWRQFQENTKTDPNWPIPTLDGGKMVSYISLICICYYL